ncbi:uncharacterized protein LOC120432097, partial [Culex pipiens pallens]|uniref:uncharacterized protein LOC120432097 n=1 Tax=Culex pipiens pallens TaxID=42434 RepID=UPI001952C6B6
PISSTPDDLRERADADKAISVPPQQLLGNVPAKELPTEVAAATTASSAVSAAAQSSKTTAIAMDVVEKQSESESSTDEVEEVPSKKFKTDVEAAIKTAASAAKGGNDPEKEALAMEAEARASRERALVPLDVRMKSFKEMLKEKEVSAFSTWEKELHKIVFDPRYLLLTSKERKQVFEKYVKDRAEEKKNKMKMKREENRTFHDSGTTACEGSMCNAEKTDWIKGSGSGRKLMKADDDDEATPSKQPRIETVHQIAHPDQNEQMEEQVNCSFKCSYCSYKSSEHDSFKIHFAESHPKCEILIISLFHAVTTAAVQTTQIAVVGTPVTAPTVASLELVEAGAEPSTTATSTAMTRKRFSCGSEACSFASLNLQIVKKHFLDQHPEESVVVFDDTGIEREKRKRFDYFVKYGCGYCADKFVVMDDVIEQIKCFVAYAMPVVIKRLAPDQELFEKLLACLAGLEGYLEGREYAACDHFTLADLCLAHTISALDVIKVLLDPKYPNVARWFEKVRGEMPKFDELQGRAEETLRAFLARQSQA